MTNSISISKVFVNPCPKQERIQEMFSYDPDNGGLIWNYRSRDTFTCQQAFSAWNTKNFGRHAGRFNKANGYRYVKVDGFGCLVHRAVWIYHNGNIPPDLFIDHLDGNRDNNRIENLRLVTWADNHKNRTMSPHNKSGYCGVSQKSKTNTWQAFGTENGKSKYLGSFDDVHEAGRIAQEYRDGRGFSCRHGKLQTEDTEKGAPQ